MNINPANEVAAPPPPLNKVIGDFRQGVKETDNNFIQKPFTYDALTRKVRELLDS